ncbi:MAG: preprotein translocase subunit SecG, partial [Janthinobacterium lividum]
MNILLFIHVVIACLLIVVILLQKTGTDSLSGIGGGSMGVV